jgi:hypothetical protein
MKFLILLLYFLFVGGATSKTIVDKAIAIQKQYKVSNNKYVVMIDYSKSIDEERLYIVLLKLLKLKCLQL